MFRLVQIDRDQIKDYVPEKMLNEHFGSSSTSHSFDSSNSIEDPLFNNTHLPNFEWQTLLSFDHWPTLFSYYNISYDNRYLSIMPSIYLPVVSSEGQHMAKAIETSSKVILLIYLTIGIVVVFSLFLAFTSSIDRCNDDEYK